MRCIVESDQYNSISYQCITCHLATRIHLARSRCVSHAMTSKGTSKSSSRPAELAREIKALEMQPQTEALDQLKRIALEHQQESSKLTTTLYQARIDAKQWLQCGILDATQCGAVVLGHQTADRWANLDVFVAFEIVRVRPEECTTTVYSPDKRNVAAVPASLGQDHVGQACGLVCQQSYLPVAASLGSCSKTTTL
jgi:hypothetical protein